jgi:hypothetical protein
VAPPKRAGHSTSSSFLPPAPTISSSRARINREPAVTAADEDTGDEQGDEDDGDEGSDGDEGGDGDEGSDGDDRGQEKKEIRFGPPRGRRQARSGSNRAEPLAEGNFYFIILVSCV